MVLVVVVVAATPEAVAAVAAIPEAVVRMILGMVVLVTLMQEVAPKSVEAALEVVIPVMEAAL